MSLARLCKCGAVIPLTGRMCADCKRQYNRTYDKYKRKRSSVYRDKRWAHVREVCKAESQGADMYQWHKYGRVIPGTLAHHITPVEDDMSQAYDPDNLIWISDASHKEIHKIYDKGYQKDLEGYLRKIKKIIAEG